MRITILIFALLLLVAACGPKEVVDKTPENIDDPEENTTPDEPDNPYEELPPELRTPEERDPEKKILENSYACSSNDDCRKYHVCTEIICANQDIVNQEISDLRMEHCGEIRAEFNATNAYKSCECVQGACQHVE